MNTPKRIFDLFVAISISVILAPFVLAITLMVLVLDGRPIFYVSERMRSRDEGFMLLKFRTMKPDPSDFGASGGNKANRITRSGRLLRRSRLDEIPQLWNVLKGDISFVGPRPPLRRYVEKHSDIYSAVLESRPGVTGIASVYFSGFEGRLLANCSTSDETELLYSRICVPRKAKLDLIYQKHQSICFDIWIMLLTVFKFLR